MLQVASEQATNAANQGPASFNHAGQGKLPTQGANIPTAPQVAVKISTEAHLSIQPTKSSISGRRPSPMDFDIPSFDLGFDSQPSIEPNVGGPKNNPEARPAWCAPITAANVAQINLGDDHVDDFWDSEERIAQVCALADQISLQKGTGRNANDGEGLIDLSTPPEVKAPQGIHIAHTSCRSVPSVKPKSTSTIIDLCTPPPPAINIQGKENTGSVSVSSRSGSAPQQNPERRLIKQPACKRPPFVEYNSKTTYQCTNEVKDAYAAVVSHARRSTKDKGAEDSVHIINYGDYFITLNELAESMAPMRRLSNTIVEIGIEYIMQKIQADAKKLVMPLRIGTKLDKMDWSGTEIKRKFDRDTMHLDRLDMVMLPILQALDRRHPDLSRHYWLFNLNIRDRRYEVLRSLSDKSLNDCARAVAACVTCLWASHYAKSKAKVDNFTWHDVGGPKQENIHDCGIFMLMNAELWDGRNPLDYKQSNIPNIRKLLTHAWMNSGENTIDWTTALRMK